MLNSSDELVRWLVSQPVKHTSRASRQTAGAQPPRNPAQPRDSARHEKAQFPPSGTQDEVSAPIALTPWTAPGIRLVDRRITAQPA